MSARLVRRPPASFEEPGPAYDIEIDGRRVGSVYRTRHAYRTAYRGERFGYDRAHLCWWGSAMPVAGDLWSGQSFRCHRTRSEVVALIEGAGTT